MKFSGKYKIITIILVAALSVLSAPMPVHAVITSDSIKAKEDEISKIEKDKKKLQNSLSDLQKMKRTWKIQCEV